jgi:hypothetical protein
VPGSNKFQNNSNLIQTRPKLDSIQNGPSLAPKIRNKIWLESIWDKEQVS